ncbi:uncharacterized protein LOC117108008 [Anneissia japonica]|uniref:uncharacterized protein LOC117108008 n=1 Tax=Anneissia japonica TaxID=1529436 RepID=UPI0014255196|nr:uncharacterized protein LOC117108008 [Anneissia japonica]
MSEVTSERGQQKKTSKTKAFKKGISKLVKSPKKSYPAVLTFNNGSSNAGGDKSATLSYGYRTRHDGTTYNQHGILKRSRSLDQLEAKDDDDTESLNSAATISVFRSVHFDSTKHLGEGKMSDTGWASSSKNSTSNGASASKTVAHDQDYIQPHAVNNGAAPNTYDIKSSNPPYARVSGRSSLNSGSASLDHINNQTHRPATLPRNTKLQSFSDGRDDTADSSRTGRQSQNKGQLQRSQSTSSSKDLDNLGVIKLVASTQNLASMPKSPAPVTTLSVQSSPQHDLSRVHNISPAQLRELEERNERKIRRTVDKILRKQRETGAPSLTGTNQKLTVWESMVLEIQRTMETLYIEKVQKERHLIRKETIKELEAEKPPTQDNETQANLTVVEARPFIKPQEVQHSNFESQTDEILEPEIRYSILKTQTDDVRQYNAASQTKDLEEVDIIESLKARLRNLQEDYDRLRKQHNDRLEEMEQVRIELNLEITRLRDQLKAQPTFENSTTQHSPSIRSVGFQTNKRQTSNLVTLTEETPSYNAGTQTSDLAEIEIISELQMKLANLEREHQQMESLYEEKVTEINTMTLEYQQNVMHLESKIKPEPKMSNVKVQVSPDVYDTGIQSSIRTSDLWTYTDPGKQYKDSSDLQIQVHTVTRDQSSSTVVADQCDIGVQYSPATRDASNTTILSMAELGEIEEYASLYRQEREETEIVTKRVRSETPELPDNSLMLKYLETSGNRSDDIVTAVGTLLRSEEAHTVSLESMRHMDVETTTDQTTRDSTGGYYSKVINSNGFGEINRPTTSLKHSSSRTTDTNYASNGDSYWYDRDMSDGGREYHHTTSGTYFTNMGRSTKLTSTPQSDREYSFEISTSSMGRPSLDSNGSVSSERSTRRFLKYGLTGQQQQPMADPRTRNYVAEP